MEHFSSVDDAITFLHKNLQANDPRSDFPNAAYYLGKSQAEQALEPLLEALQQGSQYIRATAAVGLGYLGKQEAAPALLNAFLQDTGIFVRCDAAIALGMLRHEPAISLLASRFTAEVFEVQKRIVTALQKIGTPHTQEALETIREYIETLAPDEGIPYQYLFTG